MTVKFLVLTFLVASARASGGFSTFSYGVSDPNTGDVKDQHEKRVGDSVVGKYSLLESDGSKRVVEYEANPATGFNAVVRKEPAGPIAPHAHGSNSVGLPVHGPVSSAGHPGPHVPHGPAGVAPLAHGVSQLNQLANHGPAAPLGHGPVGPLNHGIAPLNHGASPLNGHGPIAPLGNGPYGSVPSLGHGPVLPVNRGPYGPISPVGHAPVAPLGQGSYGSVAPWSNGAPLAHTYGAPLGYGAGPIAPLNHGPVGPLNHGPVPAVAHHGSPFANGYGSPLGYAPNTPNAASIHSAHVAKAAHLAQAQNAARIAQEAIATQAAHAAAASRLAHEVDAQLIQAAKASHLAQTAHVARLAQAGLNSAHVGNGHLPGYNNLRGANAPAVSTYSHSIVHNAPRPFGAYGQGPYAGFGAAGPQTFPSAHNGVHANAGWNPASLGW